MGIARELPAVVAMASLFTVSILLGMVTSYILPPEYRVFGEDTESLVNPLVYVGMLLGFTAIMMLIIRLGKRRFLQFLFLGIVGLSAAYVAYPPLLRALAPVTGYAVEVSTASGAALGVALSALLWKHPEWYIIDLTGVVLSAGVAAILGFSMGTLPILILLAALAVYDAVAVYRTRHMVALADSVLDLRLPALLVIPKRLPYSFLKQPRLKEMLDRGEEREAMFMGLGDIVFPGILVVSSLTYLDRVATPTGLHGNLLVALATLGGALIGFAVLMTYVLKGKPQAGLPLLNGGAIGGYLVSAYAVYGNFGLKMPF